MKKKLIFIAITIAIITFTGVTISLAETNNETTENKETDMIVNSNISDSNNIQDEIDSFVYDISTQGVNRKVLTETISRYKELSKEYTNAELADMLQKSKETFGKENIQSESLDNINKLLRNFEAEDLNKIIENIDIENAISELSSGATVWDLIKTTAGNMTTQQKAGLFASVVLSSKITHIVLNVLGIIIIYKLFTRCVIYKKAHKHAWAVLIPVYREVVMLKICGMSPWWLLLALVPVIGWFILWLVHVASRFMLAESFGKGELFGLGLWLLWPIFETVLVFSRKTKYIGFEEDAEEEEF